MNGQPRGDDHAERGVHGKLGEQVARQPPRRVVHRDRGAVQVGGAEQPDHPIPQILALQQNEDRDDEHDGRCGQRFDNRRDDALRELNRRQVRLMHLHRDRLLRVGGWCRGRGGTRFGLGGDVDMSRLVDEAAREISSCGTARTAAPYRPSAGS